VVIVSLSITEETWLRRIQRFAMRGYNHKKSQNGATTVWVAIDRPEAAMMTMMMMATMVDWW